MMNFLKLMINLLVLFEDDDEFFCIPIKKNDNIVAILRYKKLNRYLKVNK